MNNWGQSLNVPIAQFGTPFKMLNNALQLWKTSKRIIVQALEKK